MFYIFVFTLVFAGTAAGKNQLMDTVAVAQYNGNCFACVNRGFMYCESTQGCYANLTSQTCTTGRILDIDSGCPILDYCNTTLI